MQNFVPANISYLHYRALEFVDPVPFPRISRKILVHMKRDLTQNRRKMYLQIIVTLRYTIKVMVLVCTFLQELVKQSVRCSVIGLAAEVRLCKTIAQKTGGM